MAEKNVSKIFVCMMVAFFLFAFGTHASGAPETIKISAVLSLTGPMADQGVQLKQAYEILVEKINAAGGVYVKEYGKKLPIELRILDDESSGQKTQMQLEATNSWGAVANLGGLGCGSFEMGTP
ncbi:MAG: ABC transporter substrate-binding protein, partial [Pseudomonadota bacterium]